MSYQNGSATFWPICAKPPQCPLRLSTRCPLGSVHAVQGCPLLRTQHVGMRTPLPPMSSAAPMAKAKVRMTKLGVRRRWKRSSARRYPARTGGRAGCMRVRPRLCTPPPLPLARGLFQFDDEGMGGLWPRHYQQTQHTPRSSSCCSGPCWCGAPAGSANEPIGLKHHLWHDSEP
jgi:hypothetical protein